MEHIMGKEGKKDVRCHTGKSAKETLEGMLSCPNLREFAEENRKKCKQDLKT